MALGTGTVLTNIPVFTEQTKFEAIVQAVAETHIAEYCDFRPGFQAGTVAIPQIFNTLQVQLASAGWTTGATSTITQVIMPIDDMQVKTFWSPYDFRAYYTSMLQEASGQLEEIPYEDILVDLFSKQINFQIEQIAFYGNTASGGAITGLLADTISGATSPGGNDATGSTVSINDPTYGTNYSGSTAPGADCWYNYAQNNLTTSGTGPNASVYFLAKGMYQALVNNVPEVITMPDLTMYTSYSNYQALLDNLVISNLYHVAPGQGVGFAITEQTLQLPGTNVTVVPFAGLGNSCRAILGPKKYLVYAVGLNQGEDFANMFYDFINDEVKFIAKWRLGIKISFLNYWVTNGVA
jgi:hypothetical protein